MFKDENLLTFVFVPMDLAGYYDTSPSCDECFNKHC